MTSNRYKATYNAWAINWKETNKGSVGLITANTAINGNYIPIARFTVEAFDYSGPNGTVYITLELSGPTQLSAQPSMYSNDQLEKYLNSNTRSGEKIIPSIAIELENIDNALSNLGRYSARIVKAVAAYSETDSDIDNDTASILLDAVATGIQIAQEYIVSGWQKETKKLLEMWTQFYEDFSSFSEFSLTSAFDSKGYDEARSRTYSVANNLMAASSKNKSVQSLLGDKPEKLYNMLESMTRKIHNMYGKEKYPMMTEKDFEETIFPIIDLIEQISIILRKV